MKKIFLIVAVFILASCTHPMVHQDTHPGCGENEVDKDGKCIVAEKQNNNASLFEQDVDSFVVTQDISEGELKGFFVKPQEAGKYPSIIMIHEWWGLNDNIKYMAKLLSKEGYNVFAIDLYGEVATDSDTAKKLSSSVTADPDKAVAKMKLAADFLKKISDAKIASLGWCFGGGQSLNLSLAYPLDATLIYYGHLTDDKEKLKTIAGPVLGIFGGDDKGITVESVNNFKKSLSELKIENDIMVIPGVGHAFANPSGANYSADETRTAWKRTIKFLEENIKK